MIAVRPARSEDIAHIDKMLRALSEELGDRHVATIDQLHQAGFGSTPAFHALLALTSEDDRAAGIALYSPLFSTTVGGAGVYLTDLWVAPPQRGTGLGSRLIAATAIDAAERWQARFVKLAVYADNPSAIAFYDRLGFTSPATQDRYLTLKGEALQSLISHLYVQTSD